MAGASGGASGGRRYRALLIGNWHYPEDPANLPDLKGPFNDVSGLMQALTDEHVGLFSPADVVPLTERASHEIAAEMEAFFADASRDDVLFVYYSGHGITADDGSLLLCGRNARTDRKLATTVSSETVNRMIRGCAAAAVVIVLDCCHAGAFKSGDLAGELAGRGRFVLTASRARDRAPDADQATGMSRFTGHLLRGLRGGAALAGSGHIMLADLYRYVHRQMTADGPVIPQQRFDGDGEIAIARLAPVAPPPAPVAPAPVAPAPVAPAPAGPSLFVSETVIDVGDVWAGETLPVERIGVTAEAASGGPAGWTAQTEAAWVSLRPVDGQLEITLRPVDGATRANIVVRNEATGETRTVRVSCRVRPPAPATPLNPAVQSGPSTQDGWTPVVEPLATAPAVITPAGPTGPPGPPPQDLRQRVYEAFDRHWSPRDLQNAVIATLSAHDHHFAAQVTHLAGTKADREARKVGGVPDRDPTIRVLQLGTGAEWVLFSGQGVYWVEKYKVALVPYREFVVRTFRGVAGSSTGDLTHIDLGDGVPRLAGRNTRPLLTLLNALQTVFR